MIRLKFYFLVFIGLLSYCVSDAQKIIYSQTEKFDFRSGTFSVVGKVNNLLYLYRGSSDGYYLDAYDESMKPIAKVILDFLPSKIYQVKFVALTDRIIVLFQVVESGRVIQYAALLDDRGRIKKDPVPVDTVKSSFFSYNRNYFLYSVSENKEDIAVYATNENGNEIRLKCTWLDMGLNITAKHTATYKTDNNAAHGEGIVNNDGTFFLPVYTPVGSKGFADQLFILALSKGQNEFVAKEFPLMDKLAAGTYMKMDNLNNRIYIGGFYTDKKNGNYQGILYGYYDINTRTYENQKAIPFSEQLRNITGGRNTKKAFNDYQVKQLIVKNDGGFVLISEEIYTTTRNSYNPGMGYYSWYYPSMSSSVREYHYNDIMAISYDNSGNTDWHSFIRKEQYSQEDDGIFSSYALVNTGGAIGFVYNDFNTSVSRMKMAIMNERGQVTQKTLNNDRSETPDWLPRSGKQISSREIIIPCLLKRQICFAKIVF